MKQKYINETEEIDPIFTNVWLPKLYYHALKIKNIFYNSSNRFG